MAYRVKVSRTAKTNAEDAYVWMTEHHSGTQAVRWFNGLVDAIISLAEFPRRCPLAPESDEIGIELHQLLYGKRTLAYRIVFAIVPEEVTGEDIVQVDCIRHGARDRIQAGDIYEY